MYDSMLVCPYSEIALAIVKSSQWAHALRNTTDSPFGGTTTPLRKLIRRMPGTYNLSVLAVLLKLLILWHSLMAINTCIV